MGEQCLATLAKDHGTVSDPELIERFIVPLPVIFHVQQRDRGME